MASALMASALMARRPYGNSSMGISLYGQALMARRLYGQSPYGQEGLVCPDNPRALVCSGH